MPVYRLTDELAFPHPALAAEGGLLAVGGDLRPERLVLAYRSGIFPWYSEGRPILWWCPAPRFVLLPEELHVPRSLAKTMRRAPYRIALDEDFAGVIAACKTVPRAGQDGTWITRDMVGAYIELHRRGIAHSVEAYEEGTLVGGLYGVSIGRVFFGESMFAHRPDASKIAFVQMVRQLQRWGFELVDCQVWTEHLERFGAKEIDLDEFLARLANAIDGPGREGTWRFDEEEGA